MFTVDKDFMKKQRREIHMYPEIDFDLPKTVALVKRELTAMGIPFTEEYGKGSVVGYINPDKKGFTIGIRADMDALKITENTSLEFKSKNEGLMHACGHDAHTAMLLGTAKALKSIEDTLSCRVKLLFQPSEEGIKSGAIMMVENGALDDVDIVAALHVNGKLDVGKIDIRPGNYMASSRHFKIEIFGESAHAASPQHGIDALAAAVRMYNAIQLIRTREVSPLEPCLCSIGKLEAGTAQNIVADHAVMWGTMRTFDLKLNYFIFEKMQKIAKGLSDELGVKIEVTGPVKSVCVYNNPYITELMRESMAKVVGEENIIEANLRLGSEDFSRMLEKRPGVLFHLGTRNEAKGITRVIHNDDFDIDEDAMEIGCRILTQFVIDNQHGVDMEKVRKSDPRN